MSSDNPASSKDVRERRASDAMPLKFGNAALKSVFPAQFNIDEADIETIDLDAVLAPGEDESRAPGARLDLPPRFSAEQNRSRLQIIKYRQGFKSFEKSRRTAVNMREIKRGDVIEIKTIVGSIFIGVLDRIRGERPDIGEILCECRYDLPDQWHHVHAASIILPVFTKNHALVNPDGTQRQASRALKMTTDHELPEQIRNLLRETFFTDITVFSNPKPEKIRFVDVWRWLKRCALKIKAIIEENNRIEREKKARRQEALRLKQEEKRLQKEARARAKTPAGKD